jgi:hypothetical protein
MFCRKSQKIMKKDKGVAENQICEGSSVCFCKKKEKKRSEADYSIFYTNGGISNEIKIVRNS